MPESRVPVDLPHRLRELRAQRRLTLMQLSARTGVSAAHLSRMEKGLRQPSSEILLRIARSYGVSLGQLIGSGESGGYEVSRSSDSPILEQADLGVSMRLLSGALPGLTCIQYDLQPHWSSSPAQHDGEEWVYVLSGAVVMVVGSKEEGLVAGDALHFDAWNVHKITTRESSASVLLITAGGPSPAAPASGEIRI